MLLTTEQLWLIIGISSILLAGFIAAIIICTCWLKTRKKNNRLYKVEEENLLYELVSIHRQCNYVKYPPEQISDDRNLIDSPGLSEEFKNSLLKINSKADEVYPCSSTSSFKTYYSINSQGSNSRCSFVTVSEGSDASDIVWSSPID